MQKSALLAAVSALLALAPHLAAQPGELVIDATLHHLGDTRLETWTDVPADPEGNDLILKFRAKKNAGEHVLSLRHRDVDNPWSVKINGKEIGGLASGKAMARHYHIIPPRTLVNGDNELAILASKKTDDIVIGDIRLHLGSLREVMGLQPVTVRVTDGGGAPVPARVTVTDPKGQMVDLYYATRLHAAVRPGISYTADGEATFELPVGEYVIHAGRGMEWGLDTATVEVVRDEPGEAAVGPVTLSISREVDTTGYVASDTHIHTYTHSGHGDASVEERLVTLAGEGVELAIATDHNHHTDYRPTQKKMKLNKHFKSVIGNEVTTSVGHMNAFPFSPKSRIPNHHLTDWILLVDDIREQGAEVVILNHPRWPQIPTGPFGVFHLNRLSGELPGRKAVPFDAMELVNSTTLQPDPMYLFVDWFALLNHGEKVTAVGTSDSHTVGAPVGQGRTYVPSSTDTPAKIDIQEACRGFRAGQTSVSLGIFCDLKVEGKHGMGDLVTATGGELSLSLRVAAPSWVSPRLARVFVNGTVAAEAPIVPRQGEPTDVQIPLKVPLPAHDAYVICAVTGDGIKAAYWRTMMPYTLAATNPVWVDADGDRKYRSPREVAKLLVKKHGTEPDRLRPALGGVDDAVAIEALSLVRAKYADKAKDAEGLREARARLTALEPQGRDVVARYLKSLRAPEKVIEERGQR